MTGKSIAIQAGKVITPHETIPHGVVVVLGQRIAAVGRLEELKIPPDAEVIDVGDKIAAPGFIDIHVHGWGGLNLGESEDATRQVAQFMARNGTTSFLPTLGAAGGSLDSAFASLSAVRTAMQHGTGAAEILGVHLEGPYLSGAETARGSVSTDSIRPPSVEEFQRLFEASEGTLRVMSIAPELDGALAVIREMVKQGVVPSAAHSAATYEQVMAAVDAGLRSVTHTFNGMIPMHHRKPGLMGAVLTCDKMNAELIADGHHVGSVAMQVLIRCKGPDKVTLVTDTTYMAGMPNGTYSIGGGRTVIKETYKASVVGGTLYGSVSPMNRDVANIVQLVGRSLGEASRMASLNPAKLIGVGARKGSLEIGKDADLVVLDEEFNVHLTMVKGQVVYRADA